MPTRLKEEDGIEFFETNKMLAALEQIHAAIWLCKNENFECAITLAAAAEGMLPTTETPHLFTLLKNSPIPREDFDYNEVINWLKHPVEPDDMEIPTFEVSIVIVRAINKFFVIYDTGSPVMRDFVRNAFATGHIPLPDDMKADFDKRQAALDAESNVEGS